MDTVVNFAQDRAVDLLSEFIFTWTELIMGTTRYDNLKSTFPHNMPAGLKTLVHYGQMIQNEKFVKYDFGTSLGNKLKYGTSSPPEMHPENIQVPIMIVNAYEDTLSTVGDV